MRGKKSYLARGGGVWLRRWRCCGGGRWRCLGSWTAAPRSGATLSNDGVTVFSSFPFLYFGFSPFRFVLSSLWFLLFSLLFFCLCFSLLSFSLFFRSSLVRVSFPPFLFFFSFTVLRSIYRAKGRGFLWLHMGSKGCGGWSAIWVQLSRFRSLFFG